MKNRSIIIISVLFSVMLIGILVIQDGWVSRAERLNSEAFDAAVYRSLQGVVKQVEEKENFTFIKDEYKRDTLIKTTRKTRKFKNRSKRAIRVSTANSIKISVTDDSTRHGKSIVRIENYDDGKQTVENSVIVGAGAQVELPEPPQFPKAPLAIPEDKIEDIEVLVQKMSSTKNPDSISLKPKEIEKLIREQLKQNDLPSNFAFCLLSKDPKKSFIQMDKELAFRIE